VERGDLVRDHTDKRRGRLRGEVCDAHAEDTQRGEVRQELEHHLPRAVSQVEAPQARAVP
jgi:hypothetical protein